MLKILVVGFGSIGKRHVDNLLLINNIEILVVSSQDYKSTKLCKFFKNINDALKEKPQAAIITNNTNEHIKTAIKLAKLKIDIFIEKPLSNSLHGIELLSKISRKYKLVTMIGCNLRFHENIISIKKLIDNNSIGKIISVQAESGSFLPAWHPYENYKKSYASNTNLGGGVVLTCIHEIDYLYWFFGNVKNTISCTGQFGNLKISAEDLSASIIEFKNGIIAEIHLDYFQQPDIRRCKIIGTAGTIKWDSDSNSVNLFSAKTKKWKQISKIKKYKRNSMYQKEILHFIKCIRKRKQTINPLIDGIETLKIALAIKKSSKLGRFIKV